MSTPAETGKTLPAGAWLDGLDGHRVWWCEGGDTAGLPVLIVHGGPGGASRAEPPRWFEGLPVRWIAIDQRGCGRSEPLGGVQANDLLALLADMERLREALGLPRWAVAGGSWGARVALAYAARCPERVHGVLLRSPFFGSCAETRRYIAPWNDWLGQEGRAALGGEAEALQSLYQCSTEALSDGTAPHEVLDRSGDALIQAWSSFDDAQSQPGGVRSTGARWAPASEGSTGDSVRAAWRVHRHYAQRGWGEADGVARGVPAAASLRGVRGPVRAVWGAADATCDPLQAHEFAQALAAVGGVITAHSVPGAGHRLSDPRLGPALTAAARAWVGDLARS